MDLTKATYAEMAAVILAIRDEVKRRNSIGVNLYAAYITDAYLAVKEISEGEKDNFTSECGPKEE